jgi:hypothetical protein
MTNNSANLNEQWREFLRRNLDARSIVEGIMDRTGFEEDEVLSYLLNMWADENLLPAQRPETWCSGHCVRLLLTAHVVEINRERFW